LNHPNDVHRARGRSNVVDARTDGAARRGSTRTCAPPNRSVLNTSPAAAAAAADPVTIRRRRRVRPSPSATRYRPFATQHIFRRRRRRLHRIVSASSSTSRVRVFLELCIEIIVRRDVVVV
jgi:hypothetical protein